MKGKGNENFNLRNVLTLAYITKNAYILTEPYSSLWTAFNVLRINSWRTSLTCPSTFGFSNATELLDQLVVIETTY